MNRLSTVLLAAFLGTLFCQSSALAEDSKPRSRTFLFTYAATVNGLPAGKEVRVWLPVPSNNDEQLVAIENRQVPGKSKIFQELTYGNRILYARAKADAHGQVALRMTYRVTRKEVKTDGKTGIAKNEPAERVKRYRLADLKVPIEGKPLDLIKGTKLPVDQLETGRVLYEIVNKHMTYAKDKPGFGQGDAIWACMNGRGNCSDFHSLFISLARSRRIPAKFEIGFPLPEKRGEGEIPGYHCWAWFRPKKKGWVPVDISEANKNPKMANYYFGNLTENRVMFSTGRDINLVPKQASPPINFLIYPHVEIDGKPYPADKVTKKFSFKDVSK